MSQALFSGKLAIVTGGGSGIGQAICKVLARDGARVVAADVNLKAAEETVSSLSNPKDHLALFVDVQDSAAISQVFQLIADKYGTVPSLLAQSAGIEKHSSLQTMSEEDFMQVLNVNLKGTFLVQKKFVECLEGAGLPGGAVVNISSIIAKQCNMETGNYAASKAGVEAFTKCMAKELAKKQIRVNCVAPGLIDTPMARTLPEHVKPLLIQMTSMKRLGKPEEVAEVVAFLLSEKSSFMTGAVVEVTGGLWM